MRSFGVLTLLLFAPSAPAGEKEQTNSLGMKLVRIEAGDFVMGQGNAPAKSKEEWLERDYDESPVHKVKISRPFSMGTTEVTNAQYEQFDPEHKNLRGKG